jgi:phosphate starvation-inducible membrane PsiE
MNQTNFQAIEMKNKPYKKIKEHFSLKLFVVFGLIAFIISVFSQAYSFSISSLLNAPG